MVVSGASLSDLNLTWGEQPSTLDVKYTSEYPLPVWWGDCPYPGDPPVLVASPPSTICIRNVFTEEQSNAWIRAASELSFTEHNAVTDIGALVLKESERTGIPVIWPSASSVRTNQRRIWQVPSHITDDLWQRLRDFIPKVVTDNGGNDWVASAINRRWRFFKTDTQEEFNEHIDQASARLVDGREERSFYTLVLWLNSGFCGGELAFSDGSVVQPIGCGAILFPQAGHPSALRHSGLPVKEGCKYLIRSDVFYRRA